MRMRIVFVQFLVAIGVAFALARAIGGIAASLDAPRVAVIDRADFVTRAASR